MTVLERRYEVIARCYRWAYRKAKIDSFSAEFEVISVLAISLVGILEALVLSSVYLPDTCWLDPMPQTWS